jgi:hypothetical protein
MEAEPRELLTGGDTAEPEEPEAREAKGEEAEPSCLSRAPGRIGGEEREAARSGAREEEERARGEGREEKGARHGRSSYQCLSEMHQTEEAGRGASPLAKASRARAEARASVARRST